MGWLCLILMFVAGVASVNNELIHEEAAQRGLSWLLGRRGRDFGWGPDTSRALLALKGAGPAIGGWDFQSLEAQLSAKQLELEIMLKLWKTPMKLTTGEVSQYVLALTALCYDPRNFYGTDLVALLQADDIDLPFQFAFNTLAICAGGGHVKRRHVRRLLDLSDPSEGLHSTDTLAMVAMALACLANGHKNRHLMPFVSPPLEALAFEQRADGSFGNLATTALAMQALSLKENLTNQWKPEEARNWMVASQAEDGSFEANLFATTEALLALSGTGYGHISISKCLPSSGTSASSSSTATGADGHLLKRAEVGNPSTTVAPTTITTLPPKKTRPGAEFVNITYTMWINRNVTDVHTINLTVPVNQTFFEVMKTAAELDARYEFSASTWPNGHYVHTIGGIKEQPIGFHFWLLYRMPTFPDPTSPPPTTFVAPGGVDDIFVQNGDNFLFWYKNI